MNIDNLTRKVHRGELSNDDLAAVADILVTRDQSNELYPYLYILGRAGAKQYRHVVEGFLECKAEPQLARLALEIVCRFWNEAARYLPYLRRYVQGVSWDRFDEVRQMAVFVSGELLRIRNEKELLGDLLRVFEDPSTESTIREDAYFALARATGSSMDELPPAGRHLDFDRDIDSRVIEQARRKLGVSG